ncbi:52 kDa repressor of the inhibitor of the protein kinase-like [Tubulanus polymorphus]|uniref:52 kDa repressor of the inhibitor of the protein kinase-like n=1 Tax=Tubulanus polymorphus TaxID=672921 RepID=UPI003DA21BC0
MNRQRHDVINEEMEGDENNNSIGDMIDEGAKDVGTLVERFEVLQKMDNVEKAAYLDNHFILGNNYEFEHQLIYKPSKQRYITLRFQRSWLSDYPWLVYSPALQGGLCKYCVMFPPKDRRVKTGQLVSCAFKNYGGAKGSDGILDKHEKTDFHKNAMSDAILLNDSVKRPESTVDYCMSEKSKEIFEKNIHILRNVVEAVIFCGKQNIPLRGHRDDHTSITSNRGNFLAILDLLGKHDKVFSEHLETGKRNAKYTSKTVQNDILNIIGLKIREKLTKCLQHLDALFAIIADEVTDTYANQEVLSVCLRFLDNDVIKEVFFYFVNLERTTGDSIANGILSSLRKYGVDVNKSRGQAYDGTSCMSSAAVGVQGRIRNVAPKALFTHCRSHVLNLAIAAACRLSDIRNMIGTINESFLFLHNSPKRQRFFERYLAREHFAKSKLPGLCKTCWVERHNCFSVFCEMFKVLCECLEGILHPDEYRDIYADSGNWNWDNDTRVKAQGLLSTLRSFPFIVAFVVVKIVLSNLQSVTSKIQESDLDIYAAYSLIDSKISVIEKMRVEIDSSFDLVYQEAVRLAEEVGTEVTVRRTVRKLIVIGCTLPVGSASAERSFSCLRRTKTYLRSTMTDNRLANLALLNIHHEMEID